MATVVQKNGIKSLSNGGKNGLVDHQHPQLLGDHPHSGYSDISSTTPTCSTDIDEMLAEHTMLHTIPDSTQEMALLGDGNGAETYGDVMADVEPEAEEPEIDIVINNVVCSFSVRCHLNLRSIALNGFNVEYRKENGMITMKLRRPYTTASIWSSGKVTCTGATSEIQAKIAARRFARSLQKLGFKVRFNNYRVVNVLGTCSMPFAIKITNFSERHKEADYEPELHPGVTYKLKEPKATLKIFSTGSVTVTAPSVADVQAAIEYIFPLVYEFRKERSPEEVQAAKRRRLEKSHEVEQVLYRAEPDNNEDTSDGSLY